MNLYLRYFDDEVVVTSADEALEFISHIDGFNMTPDFVEDFREYTEGSMPFPKKYKVRPRVYFIVIKTQASTLEEFKANGKGGEEQFDDEFQGFRRRDPYTTIRLNEECPGWYDGTLNFKRVVINSNTGKFDYMDTTFQALVKAVSPLDCYNRIVEHLRSRDDVDPRSQFPSAKGKNYKYVYLGLKPYEELGV